MGSYVIRTPDIGEGIAEVEVVAWHVKIGDSVAEDQVVAELMTDKATVEVPSPTTGTVAALGAEVGASIAVGAELLRLEVAGPGNVKGGAPAVARADGSTAEWADASTAARADGPAVAKGGAEAAAPSHPSSRADAGSGDVPESMAEGARGPAQDEVGAGAGDGPDDAGATVERAARAAGSAPAARDEEEALRPRSRASAQPPVPTGRGAGKAAAPDELRSSALAPLLRQPGERPLASPAVRRVALELGIELRFVRGTGPAGRILKEDLLAYQGRAESLVVGGGPGATPYALREGETAIPVIGLRRRIAQKMQEAKRRIPHFSYVEEIDVTDLETTRAALNARYGATRGKLTVLPLLARALVIAVRDFPQMNARYDDGAGSAGGAARVGGTGAGAGDSGAGDSGGGGGGGGGGVVTRYAPVHLGIATQTDNGLMVPVVRHAEARDPWSCAAEIARLSEAARSGRGTREELSGSTITITSLGPLGGIVTTPVINHPEVAIVGVNKIVERPVVRDNTVVVRKLMNLSSSFDHRVVDGMDAAAFVQAIRRLLESPALLFVD